MKHYVVNLERRVDKRNFWLGWNIGKGIPGSDVTYFPAIDGHAYGEVDALSKFAVDQGFTAWREIDPNMVGANTLGRIGLRISHDLLLRQIADSDSTERYVIWNDDEMLLVEYAAFRNFVERLEPGMDLVGVPTNPFESFGKKRWRTKGSRRHATLPLYQGCVGSGYNQCMIVNREGAAKLLEVGQTAPANSYLELAFTRLEDAQWAWQSALINKGRLTVWTNFFSSDIIPGRPYDENMEW